MKRNLHLVYAFPELKRKWRVVDAVLKKISGYSLKERCYKFRNWPYPTQAPLSISFNICEYFSNTFNIFIYDITDQRDLFLQEGDVFLGHAWPDFKDYIPGNNFWKTYDPNNITNKVILRYPNDPRVKIIMPFNHSLEQNGWLEPLLGKIHTFIGISGDYWVRNFLNYPLANRFLNFKQLNMSIDRKDYPLLKKSFNNKNQRKFLYVGRVSKEKNIDLLEEIAKSPGFNGGYISDGEGIKGWQKISDFRSLTPKFVESLVKEYDFFVTTSKFDAQATTILEAMAWGFMILCTEQTGYSHDSMFLLDLNNMDYNSKLLKDIQNFDESILFLKQVENIKLLDEKYSWERFNSELSNIIFNS